MASWLDKYGSTPAPASSTKGSWLDNYWQDFSNVEGSFTFEDRPADVPVAPFDPANQREQTYPEQPGLLAQVGDSLGRMAQPLVSGVTAPLAAGVESIPAQAQGVAAGAQRAYAELTPDWMYPAQFFGGEEGSRELELIRETMGVKAEGRYKRAQKELAEIKQEAIEKGADPYSLDVATALPQFGLMAAGSMVNPTLGVGLLASTTAPQQYASYREQGLSPEQAALAATTATAAESVTSLVPASLINRASTMGRAPAAAAIGAAEGSQETSTALLQQAQDTALGLRDGLDVGEALYQGTVGLGIGAGTGASLGRTGVPSFDAGVQSVQQNIPEANVSGEQGVELPTTPPEPVSAPEATSVVPEAQTPSESVTERSEAVVEAAQPEAARYSPTLAAQVVDNRIAALQEASRTGRLSNEEISALVREEEELVAVLREHEARDGVVSASPRGRLTDEELSFITNRRNEIRSAFEQNRASRSYEQQLNSLQQRLDRAENDNDFIAIAESIQPAFNPIEETQANTTQEATEALAATTPTPTPETVSQSRNTEETVEETDVDAQPERQPEDPLSFLDTPPTNKAAEVAARGEVIREMAAEGWTASQAKRRAEMARRMTERGFPETPLPDATARTERETQAAPLQQGEFARVWNEDTEAWTDARVENVEGDSVTVSFRDGTTRSFPDTEVERGERNAPAWVSEMPPEAPVTASESVSVPEATQAAQEPQTASEGVTERLTGPQEIESARVLSEAEADTYAPNQRYRMGQGTGYAPVTVIASPELVELARLSYKFRSSTTAKNPPKFTLEDADRMGELESIVGMNSADAREAFAQIARDNRKRDEEVTVVLGGATPAQQAKRPSRVSLSPRAQLDRLNAAEKAETTSTAQPNGQPEPAKPIETQTAIDVLRQLREEGRIGDKARFDEIMKEKGVAEAPPAASLLPTSPARSAEEIEPSSLASPEQRQRVQESSNDLAPATTAAQALDTIAQRTQGDSQYARLIDSLRKANITSSFRVVEPEDVSSLPVDLGTDMLLDQNRNIAGIYNPNTEAIYVKGSGWRDSGVDNEVVLHEIVHAATLKKIKGVRDGTIKDRETIDAVNDLTRLWTTFKKQSDNFSQFDEETKFYLEYAALNPDEFISVTQTNKQAQEALKKEGLWDRFVNLVRRILGLSRMDKPLLDSILDAGLRVIEAQGDAETDVAPERSEGVVRSVTSPAASEAPPTTDPRIEAIRTSEQGPEGAAQKRMRAVSNVVKGLLNPYGVAGKNVEKIRQVESTGRINEALYLAGVPSRRLVVEAKAAGVNNRVVSRALRSGNLSQLPKTVQTAAKAIQTELQSIHFAALEEYLKDRPANQKLSKSEMDKLNKVVSDNFQLPEIYRRDIDPNYSTNLIRNWKKGKLSAEDKQVVENALNDVLAQVLIPQDLTQRVENGQVGKQDLVDYHQKWVGTGVSGKSVEQLTEELNNTRDMFLREMKTEDAVAMWALNSLAGANPPLNLSRYPSQRYDLTEGNVPESIRKLWGEVDDVAINVQHAWAQAASQLGQYRMMNTLAEQWRADGTATEAPQGKNTIRIDGKEAGALRGLFVSPAKADAIKSITDIFEANQSVTDAILKGDKAFATSLISQGSRGVRKLSGYLKAQAIIGNPANWWFSLAGSPETIVASGNVPYANRKGFAIQGLKEGVQGLLGTTLIGTRKNINPYTAELLRVGMTESAQVGEIANLMRDAEVRQVMQNAKGILDGVQKLWNLVQKGGLEITNFYSILDLWAPAVTYFKNKEDIKGHWGRTGVEYTDAELEREAAHMTKNTTATMSYIPKIIRLTENHGLSYVLPYLFAAHRAVVANQIVGMRQMWEGYKTNDMDYARVGLMRFLGNAGMATTFFARMSPFYVLGALPFVMAGHALRYLTDSDDEEDKAVLEAVRQDDRLKMAQPAVLYKDDNGTYYIVDMNRVLVNEPGLISAEVVAKTFTDLASGDISAEEAASAIWDQAKDQVFANASMVRLFRGITNPASQSTMRREAREVYDEYVGDNGFLQRAQLAAEVALPKTTTTTWNEAMRQYVMDRPSPEGIAKLKALGFPIYEINPGRDAGGENYFTGTKRFFSDYRSSRDSLKQSVGLLANVSDNNLEAAYTRFAREQLESYRRTAPVIDAAYAQGFTAEDIEERMKMNRTNLPANTRTAMLNGYFELPEINDKFFEGELRMARQEAAKYPNPEDKLAEWEDMYAERRESLRDIRILLQEQIDEGVFK